MKPAALKIVRGDMTREEWLERAIHILLDEKFKPLGYKFNEIKVSVGFPSTKKAIGQWWEPKATKDGKATIFIHPGQGLPNEILAVLVHELVHDACGVDAGHGKIFKKCALAVGLEGKMKSTVPGKDLDKYLTALAKRLGNFPHSALKPNARPPVKKQTTRMVKMECQSCGFIARAAMSKILEVGAPSCACNNKPLQVEIPDEE